MNVARFGLKIRVYDYYLNRPCIWIMEEYEFGENPHYDILEYIHTLI